MTLQPIEAAHPARVSLRKYTGQQAAEAVGLSWQRFRKVRAVWTRTRDFPAEINEPGEPVRYLADAVDRWVERRTRRVHAAPLDEPNPAAGALTSAALAEGAATAASHGRRMLRHLKGAA